MKNETEPIGRTIEEIAKRFTPMTDEQQERIEKERKEREEYAANQRKGFAWSQFIRERGSRYDSARFHNYDVTGCDKKKTVVDRLLAYAETIPNKNPSGVILFGPKGTGKDHLLVALSRIAIGCEKKVLWRNGLDIYADVRDAISSGRSEESMVQELESPDFLYISDPLPPVGSITEFQSSFLFRVLDRRYSDCKATWVSLNVTSATELETRIGGQNADRLRDGSIALFCDWPSYRNSVK